MPLLPKRLRLVSRRLSRAPLFTAVAVLTLALGIGANAAIFSVVNGVLLKPLPFTESDRLVGVWLSAPGLGFDRMNLSPAMYFTFREAGQTFADVGLWDNASVSVTGIGEPERVQALLVTDGTLGLLGVEPMIGRRFTREDDSPTSPERVMLAQAYWQRKFGSDASVIGRQVIVDGKPREIIGVLPPQFRFLGQNPQLLLPFRFDRAKLFIGNFSYQGVARLKPDVTVEQAGADVGRMIPLAMERFPLPPGLTMQMVQDVKLGPNVHPLSEDVIGDVGQVLWVLLGVVGIVLLIACANVANLFLVRAEGRQQELAIHAALGANWRRITWELLSESLTLAVLGGLAGLGLAYAGIRALVAMAPQGLPRLEDISIDPVVLLFTLALSLLAGVLFGVIPVLKFATPHVAGALKEGGRLSSAGRERHRARNTLVIVEIGLAVVLLVASGLMIRTFQAMRNVEPGFAKPEEVLTLRVAVPESLVPDPEASARTHEQIARRLEQIPGVISVGLSSSITMDGFDSNDPIFVEEFPTSDGKLPPLRRFKWVGENFFGTMGNPLLAGRSITWNDIFSHAQVVMVSENFAREYWKEPGRAIGKRVRENPNSPWRTIVGVVGPERDDGVVRPAPAIVYWPMVIEKFWDEAMLSYRNMGYAVRTPRLGSPTLLKEVQQAVWSVNPNLPVANVQTLEEIQSDSMAQTSFALVMLSIAAAVALALGVVGIYGVISYIATQRTREIGIRIALGANRGDVSRLFLRHGVVLAAAGIALGVVAAALVTRVMSSLLFGVGAIDPVTYSAVAATLASTAVLATYLPATRASRVDPAEALRWEA
jgi:putative ABC transport system permease protein